MKKCGKCKEIKPLTEFRKYNRISGYQSYCKICENKYKVEWHKRNRDIVNKRSRKYYKNNKQKVLAYSRKRLYNILEKEYQLLLKEQNFVCAICKSKCATYENLSVDHCHNTNKIRGLLCNRCNRALGMFEDNISLLKKVIKYLEKNDAEKT